MTSRRQFIRVSAGTTGVAALAALAACSPSQSGSSGGSSGKKTVTFRLWDEQVAKSYKKSFAEFSKKNKDIDVRINVIPWDTYWTKLPTDLAGGNADDIFWLNSSNFGNYADAGRLVDISKALPGKHQDWQPSVVKQFTRDGALYGVPQLSDSIALFYNKAMVKKAGIDPSNLQWDPSGTNDNFIKAAKKLTIDKSGTAADQPGFKPKEIKQYGFNAAFDLQAIFYNFVGSNGGAWQAKDDTYVYADDPKTVQAIQYVVDLINKYHVAPSAADTNDDGNYSLNQFNRGRMALFESGTYNLKNIADAAKFDWGIAHIPAGPTGRVSVVNGIIAAGNAKSTNADATKKVLDWIGSKESADIIAADGSAFPAVTSAAPSYTKHWKKEGVDTKPFIEAAGGKSIGAPHGPKANNADIKANPILKEMFLGRLSVKEGLTKAQAAANKAIK
ncbi:ABC transporter substrate-binding protein [Spelaeicoccus albus]|uniref:Multiple sugar transport system substrate-binding protein n=1 Tax=Spelaeicoccus albus TaxID=1280376 RepID=A0A7Z0AAL9_9MICO|nr:sugar ABC transporter substrate-binding protein [Spelaeicoccus albus]NYI66615.1 multiple sugar transport system substrate-binding protein [Spelaeicoccus albus]